MMTDLERVDYLIHIKQIISECATLLDVYHLGDDRPVIQRTFDDLRAIRQRLCAEHPELGYCIDCHKEPRLEDSARCAECQRVADEHWEQFQQRTAHPARSVGL